MLEFYMEYLEYLVEWKTLEQKVILQIGTLNPHDIKERFSFN